MQQKLSTYSVFMIIILAAFSFFLALTNDVRQKLVENFYQITKNDPLFFDYSLDVNKFHRELALLKSKEDEFLKTYREYLSGLNKDIFQPEWRLFPIEFLEMLAELNQETDSFLENPSFLKAGRLVNLQKKTIKSYGAAAQAQLDTINRVIEKNPWHKTREIRFLGSATTLGIVKSDFELILENGKALEEEIARREKCLTWGECKIKIQNAKLKSQNKRGEISKDIELLPLDILAPFENYDAVQGPYFIKTGCFGFNEDGTSKEQPFYLFEKHGEIFPKLATENYYLDLKYMEGRWSLAEIFLAEGAPFDQQPETADYRCPDLTYWAKLFDNKLEVLPHFTRAAAEFLEFLTLEQQLQKKSSDKLYLLTARSDYSIFYLPFSPSVWRIETVPQYMFEKSPPLSRGLTTYSDLKARGYTDEEIKKFNVNQIKVLREESER